MTDNDNNNNEPIKIFLAEVINHNTSKELVAQRMEELQQLVETYGGMTIVQMIQQRVRPDYRTYIGSGKVEEIIEQMKETWAKLLIVGNILKPQQIYNLSEKLREEKLQARDRVDLILKIFERHATSSEARLQIELAAIKHMGPRIFGMGMELSRQWGGKGNVRGIGETNTEIMRRHLFTRKTQLAKELAKYEQVRQVHRDARKRNDFSTVWLVGYTNAGKSSVMNALTKKWVLVEDRLFATLWTDVGELYLPSAKEWSRGRTVLVNDTIWFMRDLPPDLISAFRSTLEDSVHADLLLHVVDINDPLIDDKIQVVDKILDTIGASQERVLVFNKIDLLTTNPTPPDLERIKELAGERKCIFISAVTGEGLQELKVLLDELL